MQSFRIVSVIAAMAMVAPGAALAQQKAAFAWRCEGDRCVGVTDRPAAARDLLQECRRSVRQVGPVSRYRSGGRDLTAAELRACNRFVIATQPPRD